MTEVMWESQFGASHEGRAAAVLDDGSEPKPAVFDAGSSAEMYQTSDWWVYDGTLGTPRASALRAACSCGCRGDEQFAIDWERVDPDAPDEYDLSGSYGAWKGHVDEVERQAVPLPADVQDLLEQLQQRLSVLAGDAPLAALRAITALDETLAETGRKAVSGVWQDDPDWGAIATNLGLTEADSRARLHKYGHLY
ncbi:hypothetical protein [Streptomyces sp. MNP-20]|uniref:hypothetical protein n=1 Tax=Streptomyces sp. MNP-20 TaxID=2721165 RepID=UPI001551AEBD|nr:hypothetical protein [Streptomyces sp. MNP-20]